MLLCPRRAGNFRDGLAGRRKRRCASRAIPNTARPAVAVAVATVVEWDETGRVDTGLLGLTTKHIYFAGSKKRFRVRYDRIVTFEPYEDGVGIMREAQTAKP